MSGPPHLAAMSLTHTLIALVVSLALAAFFGWRGARAPDLIRGPRMAPYRFLMVLAAAVALVMVVHLVNLAGFQTGR